MHTLATLAPDSALQRAGWDKVLGLGRPSQERTRALAQEWSRAFLPSTYKYYWD